MTTPTPRMMAATRAPRARPVLAVTVGVPAAGKSTWSSEFARRTGAVVISRDTIREHLYGASYLVSRPDPYKEAEVTRIQRKLVTETLVDGRSVVVDDMTLHPAGRRRWSQCATCHGARFEMHVFPVPLAEALRRNGARDKVIPAPVVHNLAEKFREYYPNSSEGVLIAH